MNIIIKETGESKSLSIIDGSSGVNWVQDLIGNSGALNDGQFVWDEEQDAYIAEQHTYDWWAQYIADSEQTDAEIEALAAKLDIDASIIRERITDSTSSDYESHRNAAVQTMREIEEEYAE